MPEAAKPITFFRPGRHTSVDGRAIEFTDAQLADAAAAYDPTVHEAPFVIGHPELNAPAYGWAGKIEFRDGTLQAHPRQVQPAFADMVNSGAFKKLSASFYLPDSPGNPKPGKLYLRHIGFLGAAAPALKGLPDASFAAGDGAFTVEFAAGGAPHAGAMGAVADLFRKVKKHLAGAVSPEAAENVLPDWQISSVEAMAPTPSYSAPKTGAVTTEIDMNDGKQAADFAEREAALKKQSDDNAAAAAALKAREDKIAQAEAAARKAEVASFAEGLAKSGKILPRHQAPLVEVLSSLPAEPVSFAEGDKTVSKAPGEILREFLSGLPAQINYAEKSAEKGAADVASFAAPDGAMVDQARLALHHKALAHQRANPNVSYVDALRAVGAN